MSSKKNCCTGKALPGTSRTGQPPKYLEKSVVSIVADIRITEKKKISI